MINDRNSTYSVFTIIVIRVTTVLYNKLNFQRQARVFKPVFLWKSISQ